MQPEGRSKDAFFVTRHSIMHVNIVEGRGGSIPFLVLDDGEICIQALAWARARLVNEEVSNVTLEKSVRAIGRMYDYYCWRYEGMAMTVGEFRLLIGYFHEDRKYGVPALGWRPVSKNTARDDERAIRDFSRWCAENYGHVDITPEPEPMAQPTAKQRIKDAYRESHRKNWDLLYHLRSDGNPSGMFTGRESRLSAPTKPAGKGVKHFPPDKVWQFIEAATCVRDRMYFLLMFFAGTRISEPAHIFVADVSLNMDGSARVVLAHPEFGRHSWINSSDKKKTFGNRRDFLANRYQLVPRNVYGVKHPLRVGWKGMEFSNGSHQETEVIWLVQRAGLEFAKAHVEYMNTVRARVRDDHPYYFVNQSGEEGVVGTPLKLSNITKSFYRTAMRIGLKASDSGVNPHGARHYVGWFGANVLKVPIEIMQNILRHAQLSSTDVYYSISNNTARKAIEMAAEKMKLDVPTLKQLGAK